VHKINEIIDLHGLEQTRRKLVRRFIAGNIFILFAFAVAAISLTRAGLFHRYWWILTILAFVFAVFNISLYRQATTTSRVQLTKIHEDVRRLGREELLAQGIIVDLQESDATRHKRYNFQDSETSRTTGLRLIISVAEKGLAERIVQYQSASIESYTPPAYTEQRPLISNRTREKSF